MDLLVLAAGMGSRFGGLKQIEPIDENGNFIIDYSIYDAIRAGFKKVVFVIKEENYEDFKTTIGKRIENKIKVEYTFQKKESYVGNDIDITQREKPWGTGHAVLCAKDKIEGDFAIINADDFYGKNSFKVLADFLQNNKDKNDFAMAGFEAINTIRDSGEVKRGVCFIKDGFLERIEESCLRLENKTIFARPVDCTNCKEREISPQTIVSMNLFGLSSNFFVDLEKGFSEFLQENKNDITKCEYYLPTAVTQHVLQKKGRVYVLKTPDKWFGLTYKTDYNDVVEQIKSLVKNGEYPNNLWE